MLSSVLYELVRATSCTGGAVYLVDPQRTGLLRAARHCEDPAQQSRYPKPPGHGAFHQPHRAPAW